MISLSKELKKYDLNNHDLRRAIAVKVRSERRTQTLFNAAWSTRKRNVTTRKLVQRFIWGFDWAKKFPYLIENSKS